MQLLPYRGNLFLDHKELHQFLVACQQNCQRNNSTRIVSISQEVDFVDPLLVFEKLAESSQINFYFENRAKGEAIAALGAVTKLEVAGEKRFSQAEEFIQSCLRNIVNFGISNQRFAGSHFFCSFGFFDENIEFNYPFPSATVFLPCWQVASYGNRCVLVSHLMINSSVNISSLLQDWGQTFLKITSLTKVTCKHLYYSPTIFSKQTVSKTDKFKQSVVSALEKIQSQHFRKIVLADALDVNLDAAVNLFQSLTNLRQLHPNCYIFATSNGRGQNFIGASPERLISIHNQQLITDALAGSAPRGKTQTEDAAYANSLINSEKERHEHLLVIDFITEQLSRLGLLTQVLPPRLRQLTNIQHLWTPINAAVPSSVHPLKIVAQLHPTPAVAGADREVACAEIRQYESFERGLYAAPLGWIDYQGNCEFIVGIRSALIDANYARLYAGAGIVAGSNPDKEWAEVQLKLQALLKALV